MQIHHFSDEGEGQPVVFLHGFCEDHSIWADFSDYFSQERRIIAPSLPGFGGNPELDRGISIDDMARALDQFLQPLHLPPVLLVGHSLGGYIALSYAEQFPEKVSGLSLFHSSAYADNQAKRKARNKVVEVIQRDGFQEFLGNFVAPLFYNGRHNEAMQPYIRKVEAMGRLASPQTAIAVTEAMRDRPDRSHILENFSIPFLFIQGREDQAVPFRTQKDQYLLPQDATLRVLPEVAHMGMYEAPLACRDILEAWFKGFHG